MSVGIPVYCSAEACGARHECDFVFINLASGDCDVRDRVRVSEASQTGKTPTIPLNAFPPWTYRLSVGEPLDWYDIMLLSFSRFAPLFFRIL